MSSKIDAPFTKNFNFIISTLDLNKEHGTKSKVAYEVLIEYNGKEYTALYKENKIIDCVELKKQYEYLYKYQNVVLLIH